MYKPSEPLLVGDIGGTNVRFAITDPKGSGPIQLDEYKCRDFDSLAEALKHYLDANNLPVPQSICLALAAPLVDGKANFLNNSWSVSKVDLQKTFETKQVWLINDFESVAYSLLSMAADEVMPIGTRPPNSLGKADFTLGVVGPGTGLGAAGLCQRDGMLTAITGEAAHIGFAAETSEQLELLNLLRTRLPRISVERVLSGPGIENLYWGLGQIQGCQSDALSAAEIMQSGVNKSDPLAQKTVALFLQILGQFAGDFALSLGAYDGVYIGGGIVQRYPELLSDSQFRASFEAKGRHRSLLETVPTMLILNRHPGLLGAINYARSRASISVP